ncbi:unnamed protein product [Fraxinus pennsylvanica]|uniref:UDP-glucose 4-epimerase n=1 Tax=Fraxinus pennsylvanica TaxID=56036 RepID=A0AAD1ZPN3_9LAMI|nr:unnamed protein product [Fraxinus pennsylvanica]
MLFLCTGFLIILENEFCLYQSLLAPLRRRLCCQFHIQHRFDAVIHFASLKAVGESVQKPLLYYNNNLVGTIVLLEVMAAHLVFSSSSTVAKSLPCTVEFPIYALNPYGRTKLFMEEMCRDICSSNTEWIIILLRYFNPVVAHPIGYTYDDPLGIQNNLMPFVQEVAVGTCTNSFWI